MIDEIYQKLKNLWSTAGPELRREIRMISIRRATAQLLCPWGCYQACPDCGEAIHLERDCPKRRRESEAFGLGHFGLHKLTCKVRPRDVIR